MSLAHKFQREDMEAAFLSFWVLWRKHMRKTDGRGKARPAWQQMIEAGADAQDIIDGATWYLRNLSERDAPYIPLAASWLRSERWADDCEQERAYQQRVAERQQREAQPNNITPIRREEQKPDIEERARHAQSILARAGFAAASGE